MAERKASGSRSQGIQTRCRQQRGAIILITVVLMLVMTILITLYTARTQSFEHRIMLNNQNQQYAYTAAEAGLMQGIAQLQQNKTWTQQTLSGSLASQEHFSVTAIATTMQRADSVFWVYEISSQGSSGDDLASVTLRQTWLVYPLLAKVPPAPLLVKGGLSQDAQFTLVASPDGGGQGIPLSIWSNGKGDMSQISGVSCGLQEYNDAQCSTLAYSSPGVNGPDLLLQDSHFPDDLFAYAFNVSFDDLDILRNEADRRLSECQSLDDTASGLIWVEGDCIVEAEITLGSQSNPVILVVIDGNLSLQTNTWINGLVVVANKPSNVSTHDIFMESTSAITGALLVNYTLGQAGGSVNVIYHNELLNAINKDTDFATVVGVPGSWQDW